jgi:streptomycin 6-kinase
MFSPASGAEPKPVAPASAGRYFRAMDVEEITARLVRRFGLGVAGWCAGVPELAASAAKTWGLTLGDPFPQGASSVALRCTGPDGAAVALKLSPDPEFLAEQAAVLRLFAPGRRVPAVLGDDPARGLLLMESIVPGTTVDEMAAPPTPEDWAELLLALHSVTGTAEAARDLRGRCEEFFVRVGRRLDRPEVAARVGPADLDKGWRRCEALLAKQATEVLLHGDLHLGNVLDGGPSRGLIAIDPKICVGDPCFDAVDYVLAGAGGDGVAFRCEALGKAYGLDADRLYEWGRAVAPVTAVAGVGAGYSEPAMAELLALAR